MNISVQAAYFARSRTLENQIQLSRVVERTMFSSSYRIASESNATASNANAPYASASNATESNAIDQDDNTFYAGERNEDISEASPSNASLSNASASNAEM